MSQPYCFPDNTVLCNFACVGQLDLLQFVLDGRGRWTEAVAYEASRSQSFHPDLEAISTDGWLGDPIEIDDERARREVEGLRRSVFGGTKDEPLKHLGESQTLWVITNQYVAGQATWVSDDRESVDYARQNSIPVRETRHVVAELVQINKMSDLRGFEMLEQMVEQGRQLVLPGSPAELHSL